MNPCRLLTVNVVWWPFNKTTFLKTRLPCVFFVIGFWQVVVVVKGGWVYS